MQCSAAILYQSYYGTTKQYAISISEKLYCDIYDINAMDPSFLLQYDTFIICSSFRSNKLQILPYLTKHKKKFENKQIVLLVTYMNNVPPNINVDTLRNKNIPIFYKEGRLTTHIHPSHLFDMLIHVYYYYTHQELTRKLQEKVNKPLQPVDDIVHFCIQTLRVNVPNPLKYKTLY